jgi:hypothetical protein
MDGRDRADIQVARGQQDREGVTVAGIAVETTYGRVEADIRAAS